MTIQIEENKNEIAKVTWVSVFTNLFLSIIKFIFGTIGNSHALIADAIHSASDLTTDFAIIIGVKFWSRPPDSDHPHGHYKIETVVTLCIGIIIFGVASVILYNSILSIHLMKVTKPKNIALFAALFSIILKEILYRWTRKKGQQLSCSALTANAIHQRSDALSSVPVAIAVFIANIYPEMAFIDQIGAIIVSILIYKASFDIIRPAINKLIDKGLSQKDTMIIYNIVKQASGVKGVHEVRTRHIGCMKVACDLHIEVDATISVQKAHDIYKVVKKSLLESNLPLVDIIIHIDPYHI